MIPRRTLIALTAAGGSGPLPGEAAAEPPPPVMLTGGFAPVPDEVDLAALEIRGTIPEALRGGAYLRNGPNPAFRPEGYTYPFDGDGMIHALAFDERGQARYRNRYVATRGLAAERRAGRALYGGLMAPRRPDPALLLPGDDPGPFKNLANIAIIRHAGRLLALWEGGEPYELGPDLSTRGPTDFGGALPRMTAHPRLDPATGELLVFSYQAGSPLLDLAVLDAAGGVGRQRRIDLGQSLMIHDFAITENWLVFLCCPLVFDLEAARRGGRFLEWRPEAGTRIALVPRGDGAIRWFDTEAFFCFHLMNAFETPDGTVAADFIHRAGFGVPGTRLERVILGADGARMETLDDQACEFPRVDPRFVGRPYTQGWLALRSGAALPPGVHDTIGRFDLTRGRMERRAFGPGQEVDEPVFVPDPARGPVAGWLLAYVYDRAGDRSRLVVLDAADIAAPEPVAEVLIPRRVPHGLHGAWMAGFALG